MASTHVLVFPFLEKIAPLPPCQFQQSLFSMLEVPYSPLDEQRRIAAILDKADALRQKRKRAIALLDGLTQSIFLDMFGDPSQTVGSCLRSRLGSSRRS